LTALGPRSSAAAIPESDIAATSKLEMLEKAVSGAYASYSISIVTREGATTLTAEKDGERTVLEVPLEETLTLWRALLEAGLEGLNDPAPESAAPDGSEFAVTFRAGEASGGFSAAGVDSLSDTRYREIIRQILKFADTRVAAARRGH
jgi:hypothetical protein